MLLDVQLIYYGTSNKLFSFAYNNVQDELLVVFYVYKFQMTFHTNKSEINVFTLISFLQFQLSLDPLNEKNV